MLAKLDLPLLFAVFGLVLLGSISLYSSSLALGDILNFQKQIIFLFIGVVVFIGFALLDYRIFRSNSALILLLYGVSILLLIGLFFLAPEVRGTKSWYRIGPISVDPVEIVKLVLIILLAKYFSSRHIEMYRSFHIVVSGLYALVPAILIFLQPNMGSALVVLAIWFGILVVSGIRLRHFLGLVIALLIVLAISWGFFLQDYQKERIVSFLSPQENPLGAGWHKKQAQIAVGSGGLLGHGFAAGPQVQFGFLPETQTDFIFAAIAEEFGFLGVSIVIGLFALLLWRIIRVALFAQDNFPRLFAAGVAVAIIVQIGVNIGMNLGLLPIVGIPLPWVSYGGSGLVMNFAALGILHSFLIRYS